MLKNVTSWNIRYFIYSCIIEDHDYHSKHNLILKVLFWSIIDTNLMYAFYNLCRNEHGYMRHLTFARKNKLEGYQD